MTAVLSNCIEQRRINSSQFVFCVEVKFNKTFPYLSYTIQVGQIVTSKKNAFTPENDFLKTYVEDYEIGEHTIGYFQINLEITHRYFFDISVCSILYEAVDLYVLMMKLFD